MKRNTLLKWASGIAFVALATLAPIHRRYECRGVLKG